MARPGTEREKRADEASGSGGNIGARTRDGGTSCGSSRVAEHKRVGVAP